MSSLQLVGDSEPIKIDEAALTGESLAVNKSSGDDILSGAVVEQGESEALVTAVGPNTFFGKTITLLNRPEEKGHLQQASLLLPLRFCLFNFSARQNQGLLLSTHLLIPAIVDYSLGTSKMTGWLQVLGRVQLVLGLVALLGVVVVLIVLLTRGEEVGYSIVICMVLLIATVPVGKLITLLTTINFMLAIHNYSHSLPDAPQQGVQPVILAD